MSIPIRHNFTVDCTPEASINLHCTAKHEIIPCTFATCNYKLNSNNKATYRGHAGKHKSRASLPKGKQSDCIACSINVGGMSC